MELPAGNSTVFLETVAKALDRFGRFLNSMVKRSRTIISVWILELLIVVGALLGSAELARCDSLKLKTDYRPFNKTVLLTAPATTKPLNTWPDWVQKARQYRDGSSTVAKYGYDLFNSRTNGESATRLIKVRSGISNLRPNSAKAGVELQITW